MPLKPLKYCSFPGCGQKVRGSSFCSIHEKIQKRNYNENRETAVKRGYDRRWQKNRKAFLAENPICVSCLAGGRVVPATVVDHIKRHKGDPDLFEDPKNWQALCKRCHDKKTGAECRAAR